MSTKKKRNTDKGKRYTADEKKAIIDLVNKVNADKGRGGQSAASKQFGVSQLTISAWLKGSAPRARKAAKKVAKKAAKKVAKPVAKKAAKPVAKKAAKKAVKKVAKKAAKKAKK
jgi:DNA-binding PadR family transcriptional regulator